MGGGANPMTGFLIRWKFVQTYRGNSYIKMEAETGVMLAQTKQHQECWKPPEARGEARKDSSLEPLEALHNVS